MDGVRTIRPNVRAYFGPRVENFVCSSIPGRKHFWPARDKT